ncbi:hypothetical protein [Micromonospora sp. NBC_01638]|uniref:hypothetical protein n=1 Tax=Micromonospora sp. NBC_01638 TaxID=2975982 RepID=UPI00386AAF82|nr:hypothetical protein OG811_15060 [Micromonospora sp. NBC_01638]
MFPARRPQTRLALTNPSPPSTALIPLVAEGPEATRDGEEQTVVSLRLGVVAYHGGSVLVHLGRPGSPHPLAFGPLRAGCGLVLAARGPDEYEHISSRRREALAAKIVLVGPGAAPARTAPERGTRTFSGRSDALAGPETEPPARA